MFVVLLVSFFGAIGNIMFFGGTHFSRFVAISSYVFIVLDAWTSFRAVKKNNCEHVSNLSNLAGFFIPLFFPVLGLLVFLGFAWTVLLFFKNMISIFLLIRRAERFGYQQSTIPKRYKAVKKSNHGNLQIGDRVRFNPPDYAPIEGTVARFNKKTVKVINKSDEYWNVPYGLLIKLKPKPEIRDEKSSLHLIKG